MILDRTLPSPDCAQIEPLLAAGIFASLDAEQRRMLADHLGRCPGCRALSADLAEHPVGAALVDEGMVESDDFSELRVVTPDNYVRGEEIGRGGMGRIVRARDRRLGRSVVLKELLDARLRDRFEQEARLTARLQHPAIVNVHEAGRWPSGDSFYAMKHVAGEPLDRAIAARRGLTERLALLPNLITVVEAVAYAHSQRVIHRDLKPANILVGPFGETVVIDWGLAKDLARPEASEESRESSPYRGGVGAFTVAGAGTPDYMPPEQAEGRAADERIDVFALGATLHHLLAGAPPRLRGMPAQAPRALAAIARKAMARAPGDRYPTAGALAEELRRFQNGQLVAAHHYTIRERLERFVRRHKVVVAAATLSLAALAMIGGVSLHKVLEARRQAEGQLAELLVERGREELARGAPGRALVYLNEARQRGLDTPALRALVATAARPFTQLEERFTLPVRPQAARFAPDGAHALTVDAAGDVALWDLASRAGVPLVTGARGRVALDFAPDGKTALVAVGTVARLYDAGGRPLVELPHAERIESARYAWPGVIVTLAGRRAATWGPAGAPIATLDLPAEVGSVSVTPDGATIVPGDRPGVPFERSAADGGHEARAGATDLSVAAGSGTVELRGVAGATTLRHNAAVVVTHLRGDGATALTAARDGTVHLWDTATGLERAVFEAGEAPIDAALDDDGRKVRMLGESGEVRVWRARGRLVAARRVPGAVYERAAFSSGGGLAAQTVSGGLEVVDREGASLGQVAVGAGAVVGFDGPTDDLIIAGSNGVWSWSAAAGLMPRRPDPVQSLGISREASRILSPGGQLLDAGGAPVASIDGEHLWLAGKLVAGLRPGPDGGVHGAVWDAGGGQLLAELPVEHRATMVGPEIMVSTSGELLATTLSERRLALWDVRQGRQRAQIVAPGVIEHVALAADGSRVLTAGAAGVQMWDADGRPLGDLTGVAATSVTFDAAGARVLVGERDGFARIWDADSGALLETFGPLPEPVTDVAFAPDGSRAVVLAGSRLALWDTSVPPQSAAELARLAGGLPLRLEGGRLIGRGGAADDDERPSPVQRARRAFEQGSELLGRGRPADALRRFADAFRADPDPEYAVSMTEALRAIALPGRAVPVAVGFSATTDAMKAEFERGQALYDVRRFEEAAAAFLHAYQIKPAGSLLFNAAVCYERLHRYRDAAELFQRYLAENPAVRDRGATEARIRMLRSAAR